MNGRGDEFTAAREILGNDFLGPEEIAAARKGVVYDLKQLLELGNTVPAKETIEWCRDNGFMLVAGPPRPRSLLDVRELNPGYFYSKKGEEGDWYAAESEAFAKSDKATCRWLMLRKEPVPGSTSKTWGAQQKLLSSLEAAPNVAEQVWGVTTYKAVRGVYLLPSVYVRTSSVASLGDHVHVGNFNRDGLFISYWHGDGPLESFGLSSSRKPEHRTLSA